ncbi:FG-GAP-like repeat-containing protein [bacterium]|nr:FG-GAP-like repeat-containing protein [bacterium]
MKINLIIHLGLAFVLTILVSCSGVWDDQMKAMNADLENARNALMRGRADKARDYVSHNGVEPSDSARLTVWGDSYELEGDWQKAADLWKRAATIYTKKSEYRLHYWNNLIRLANKDSSKSDSLRLIIKAQGNSLYRLSGYDETLLAYQAAVLLEDSTVETRGDRLIEKFPEKNEVINIVGSRFWDGLYPIWNNNKARIVYLSNFVNRYQQFSWKHTAWRLLINACLEINDTTSVLRESASWVNSEPKNPYVLITAAGIVFGLNEMDSARVWASKAYRLKEKLKRLPHIPEEEWLLYGPSIKAEIPLKLAEVNLYDGNVKNARELANESYELAIYGDNEYATNAAQHYLLGRVCLAEHDTNTAITHFVKTITVGEVRNYNPDRADSLLKNLLGLNSDVELLELCRQKSSYNGVIFTRITESSGLTEARGGRFSWGDYDNDNDDDLLIGGSKLYRNDEGYFNDVTEKAGINAQGCHGGIWGDSDNDGDLDLFCFSSSNDLTKAERLFRNLGNGTFKDITNISGDIQDTHSTEAAIWGDFNGDDQLDLFITGYEKPYEYADEMGSGWQDRLLIQNSQGIFTDRTIESGMIPAYGKNLCGRSPVSCDFDRDGDLDIYVGNYRLQPNLFWINEGKGKFTNEAAWHMIDGEQVDGWWGHTIGCQWGDFDNDLDFDLIVGNLAHPRYIRFSNRTMLYKFINIQSGFKDVRKDRGIKYDECHSEPVWGDLDNDGDIDLYITSVYPNRRSYLYINENGYFRDITYLSGTRVFNGWGSALADYDNDGDLDLVTRNDNHVELFRNDTECGNWVEIVLTSYNIGAITTLETASRKQIRQVEGGKGAGNQSSLVLHFGIGKSLNGNLIIDYNGISKGPVNITINEKNIINFTKISMYAN